MASRSFRKYTAVAIAACGLGVGGCGEPLSPGNQREEYILFLSTRHGAVGSGGHRLRDIYRMRPDGSGVTNLTRWPSYLYDNLSTSPDGRWILFASDRPECNIWIMKADGADLSCLVDDPSEGGNTYPRWSPDGTQIAFLSNRERRKVGNTVGLHDVYVMSADGSNQRNVSHSLGAELGFNVSIIGWSPAGQIVFETNNPVIDGFQSRVYAVNADGTGMRKFFDHLGDHAPAWSPDGSLVAFISSRDGRKRLYVMNADGTGARPLTDHAGDDRLYNSCCGLNLTRFDVSPWSPDGKRIAFERYVQTPEWDGIYTAGVDGTGLTRLTNFPSSFNGWSANGTMIALTRRLWNAPPDIYLVSANGTSLRNLTNSSSEDTDAFWVRK